MESLLFVRLCVDWVVSEEGLCTELDIVVGMVKEMVGIVGFSWRICRM